MTKEEKLPRLCGLVLHVHATTGWCGSRAAACARRAPAQPGTRARATVDVGHVIVAAPIGTTGSVRVVSSARRGGHEATTAACDVRDARDGASSSGREWRVAFLYPRFVIVSRSFYPTRRETTPVDCPRVKPWAPESRKISTDGGTTKGISIRRPLLGHRRPRREEDARETIPVNARGHLVIQ